MPYAGPMHFGWRARAIDPNPFLYDALDERRDEVVAAYEKQTADLLKKAGLT